MKCTKGHELKVYSSNAGFYIGTWDEEGPFCRCSANYYPSKLMAQDLLDTQTFMVRNCMENDFCNQGKGCVNRG